MTTQRRDWNDTKDKFKAIRDVLRHILSQNDKEYDDLSRRCLADNEEAKQLFIDKGEIDPPAKAKIVFVPPGDSQRPDKGSLRLEPPPPNASGLSDDDLLNNYLLSASLAKPSSSTTRQWKNLDDRAAAVVEVLRHIISNQNEVSQCLQSEQHSCDLFTGPVGRIQPPPEIKIIFMPPDQVAAGGKGSLVLEMPILRDTDLVQASTLCCYKYWDPNAP